MTASRFVVASAALSGLMVLAAPVVTTAQHVTGGPPVGQVAAFVPGSLHGLVRDEAGLPVGGVMISALGATTSFAFTGRDGRFEIDALAPGPYVVRAYLKGFQTPRPALVEVRSSGRAMSSIALRRVGTSPPVLAAGAGGAALLDGLQTAADAVEATDTGEGDTSDHGDGDETLWRLRHVRRGVLKSDTAMADFEELEPEHSFWAAELLSRAVAAPARVATSFFTETPFSGQVNLLTTGSLERPDELRSAGGLARGIAGIAHVSVGAAVGDHADWTVNGAMSEADLSSWVVAGSYVTRSPANHRYDVGVSYSAQRYAGGNPLALRGVPDVTRNASSVHGFDTFTIAPQVKVTYGARYARYDYLDERALVSPRVEVLLVPSDRLRVGMALSRSAHAPGAEEFLPPGDTGLWLPPQRTFSALEPGRPLEAERMTHVAVEVERDVAGSTLAFRAFRQRVDGQLVTLFGLDAPDQPASRVGHYFVGNAGDVDATGGVAEVRAGWAGRVQGSVSYTLTRAEFDPASGLGYLLLLAPAALRPDVERIHDVSTTIAADVPETATRVLLVYRLSNGFAGAPAATDEVPDRRHGFDYRFDVQVRQSLPFMSFSNARWEMLLAVRNFFREAEADPSVHGELLVVRPPKRIVGGVTLHF
jgi:hypothetical protein